jgi:hypothetical protein
MEEHLDRQADIIDHQGRIIYEHLVVQLLAVRAHSLGPSASLVDAKEKAERPQLEAYLDYLVHFHQHEGGPLFPALIAAFEAAKEIDMVCKKSREQQNQCQKW